MSEPIPESIPTSQDPRSKRPTKRRALTPTTSTATALKSLFSNPTRPIHLPPPISNTPKTLPPPPEIVANVQGSSAGAGSGEFHVYKASRRREYERIRLMEEEVKEEGEKEEFERKKKEREIKDREKTERNRRKRRGKGGKKGGNGNGPAGENEGGLESGSKAAEEERKKREREGTGESSGEPVESTDLAMEGGGLVICDDDE